MGLLGRQTPTQVTAISPSRLWRVPEEPPVDIVCDHYCSARTSHLPAPNPYPSNYWWQYCGSNGRRKLSGGHNNGRGQNPPHWSCIRGQFVGISCWILFVGYYIQVRNVYLFVKNNCKTVLISLIRSRLGFYGIFGTCGLLNLLNVVYLMQFVKESLTKKASPEVTVEKSLSFWALVKDFFDWTHIRSTIEFAFAHVGDRRLHLFVLSLLMLFTAGPIFGELINLQ